MHKPGRLERRGILLAAGVLIFALFGLRPSARAAEAAAAGGPPIVVLAAASLKDSVEAVGAAYGRTGRTAPSLSFAASSALARQIDAGAPADIFVSADEDWMNDVERRGFVRKGARVDLLTNRLVLIAPKDSVAKLKIEKGFALAAALGSGRLAVAGDAVPAGIYAKAALEALGVFAAVQEKLAKADNVRGALFFVAAGEAPFGIVYETDALVEPKVKIVDVFPDASHPPIVYPAALLKGARPEADAFFAFLKGPQARAIFTRYGFKPIL
jgi:molybdate transport system substrate-binding protein